MYTHKLPNTHIRIKTNIKMACRNLCEMLHYRTQVGHSHYADGRKYCRRVVKCVRGSTSNRLRFANVSRLARYNKLAPMCERVVSMGIGLPLLLALEIAVIKKIEVDGGVPAGAAPYRVLQEIEDYNKLGEIKKQLYDASLQLSIMKEILGRHK